MKKRSLAAGLALALSLSLTPLQAANTTYLDVDRTVWYSTPIAFCQQHLLMDGPSQRSFAPEEPLTRAVLAEALYRLEGSPALEESDELPFTDVAGHPNLPAIRWAKENGVVSGYEDGTFRPESSITREEIAVLLWTNRAQQQPAGQAPYTDRDAVSDWALPAVEWAYEARMMAGNTDGTFLPRNNTTRAEGATIIASYAREFYGMTEGYTLPEPSEIPPNPYRDGAFQLDERGYLSYEDAPFTRGLDVSAHQKVIDWSRVAATGMRFAMVRAGYRGYTQGTIQKDEYFDANMSGALANGMEVGVYFFSQAITPQEAEEEADYILSAIEGYNITYPIAFDWEPITSGSGARTESLDNRTLTQCAAAFCAKVREAGYTPAVYFNQSLGYLRYDLRELADYDLWLAEYDSKPDFYYHFDLWQYTHIGRVAGIEGDVDLDLDLR